MAAQELNLTHAELTQVLNGSAVHEEFLDALIDVSMTIPLEFTSRLGSSSTGNKEYSWYNDRLAAPVDSVLRDGQDMNQNDTRTGVRVMNQVQINGKEVRVSLQGEAADSVAGLGKISTQVSRRGAELRRDIEQRSLQNSASVIGDPAGDVTGQTAGLEAWLDGEVIVPGTQPAGAPPTTATWTPSGSRGQAQTAGTIISGGVSNIAANVCPAWIYEAGVVAPGAITETIFNTVVKALYVNTGSRANRTVMNTVSVHEQMSKYYFVPATRVATLTAETNGNGPAQAMTAVNSVLTDWGICDLVANVFQPPGEVAANLAGTEDSQTTFILDFSKIEMSTLTGFRVEPLAKTGLSEKRLLSKSWGMKVLSSEAQGMIQGIDGALAMTL